MSELLRGEVDGEPLTDEQLVSYCELLVEAGNETTRNAVSAADCSRSRSSRTEWERLRDRARAAARRRRGDPAMGEPDQPLHPHRHRGFRGPRARRSAPASKSRSTSRRRTVTRRCSTTRSPSASTASRTTTSRSASVSTSAWARTSPASNSRRSSATCSTRLESFEVVGAVERLSSITNGSIKHLPMSYTHDQRPAVGPARCDIEPRRNQMSTGQPRRACRTPIASSSAASGSRRPPTRRST